jgi:uncharacterized protein HemX
MSTFLFEDALKQKGYKKADLSDDIKKDLGDLTALCRKLTKTPDDDAEALDKLNSEIDQLDMDIANKIKSYEKPAPEAEKKEAGGSADPTPEPAPAEEEESESGSGGNGLIIAGVLGAIGIGLWYFLSGGRGKGK